MGHGLGVEVGFKDSSELDWNILMMASAG